MTVIAITGPGGVLGRHALAQCKQAGLNTISVGRDRWDLRQYKSAKELDTLMSNASAVMHFGAFVPEPGRPAAYEHLFDANVRACLALGEWAASRGIYIAYAGTCGVYRDQGAQKTEDTPLAPLPDGGFYGLTKFLGERTLAALETEGLPLCILRISSVYGAGMHPEKVVAKMLSAAASGGVIRLHHPVDDRVNFVHAADVARAALAATQLRLRGVYNIAAPNLVSMRELAEACIAVTGAGSVEVTSGEEGRSPTRRFDVSSEKATRKFDYQPRIDIREGLSMMYEQRYVE